MSKSNSIPLSDSSFASSVVPDFTLLNSYPSDANNVPFEPNYEPTLSISSIASSKKSKNTNANNCCFFIQLVLLSISIVGGFILFKYLEESNQINKQLEEEKTQLSYQLQESENMSSALLKNISLMEEVNKKLSSNLFEMIKLSETLMQNCINSTTLGNSETITNLQRELKKEIELRQQLERENELLRTNCNKNNNHNDEVILAEIQKLSEENSQLKNQNKFYLEQLSNKSSEVLKYENLYKDTNMKLIELQTQYSIIQESNQKLESDMSLIIKDLIKSSIVKSAGEFLALKGFFSSHTISFDLIYDSLRDGHSYKKFNMKIKQFVPNLVLIETKDGNKFGGFTQQDWKPTDSNQQFEFKEDEDAFLFNLKSNKKFSVSNLSHAIKIDSSNLMTFGENDLIISSDFSTKKCFSYFPKNYGIGEANGNELTNNQNEFYVKKIEVFIVNN